MANLSVGDVLALARLARIELDEAELKNINEELSSILAYVEQLSEVDLKDDKPTVQVTGLSNVTRPDEVIEYQASPDDLLKNLPKKQDRYIQTRRVLE